MIIHNPLTDAYPIVSGTRCIQITIPDDDSYAQLIAGLYGKLCEAGNWTGDSDDRDAHAALMLDVITDTDWEGCLTSQWIYGGYTRLFPGQEQSIVGNGLIYSVIANQYEGGAWLQNAPAIHDSRVYQVALVPGTYDLFVCTLRTTANGILTIYADGALILTQDLYNGSLAVNQIYQSSTFVVADNSNINITTAIDSKNASSSAYRFYCNYIDVRRVGA